MNRIDLGDSYNQKWVKGNRIILGIMVLVSSIYNELLVVYYNIPLSNINVMSPSLSRNLSDMAQISLFTPWVTMQVLQEK